MLGPFHSILGFRVYGTIIRLGVIVGQNLIRCRACRIFGSDRASYGRQKNK